MPWHQKAMKDVATNDKPRIGGNSLRPEDLRMGQSNPNNVGLLFAEFIGGGEPTGRSEISQYPEEEKANCDFLSSDERKGNSPNLVIQ